MKWPIALMSIACLSATAVPALSNTIIVDGSGGGDHLTIQEGVDAASNTGDVVMVMPGTYSDTHALELFGMERQVNVFFEKGITLVSSDGPEVTIIDGGGITDYGIIAMPYDLGIPGVDPFPPIVEGFTVRNGRGWSSVGIAAIGGEARGNITTEYYFGLASGAGHDYTGISGGIRSRTGATIISENTSTGNDCGIWVSANEDGFAEATVSNNTVTGNGYGVEVNGPDCWARLVGNEISQNSTGVRVSPGPSWQSGTLDVMLEGNRLVDNTSKGIWVDISWSSGGYWINVTIGGTPGKANDIYGSPRSLFTYDDGAESVVIDARYNYWGSTLCDEFVPLFDVDDPPAVDFTFLPFVDESHTVTFDECENSAVEETTWGAIKALYRQGGAALRPERGSE